MTEISQRGAKVGKAGFGRVAAGQTDREVEAGEHCRGGPGATPQPGEKGVKVSDRFGRFGLVAAI